MRRPLLFGRTLASALTATVLLLLPGRLSAQPPAETKPTEKASAEHYRKTGKFPDGATLVKEIRKLETSAMTTGDPVVWGSDAAVWFVMVKDAKGRFASNPLWGDGWGWALFKADAPAKNVAVSYAADCMGCHVPAAKTDRVFIQGYPTLTQH